MNIPAGINVSLPKDPGGGPMQEYASGSFSADRDAANAALSQMRNALVANGFRLTQMDEDGFAAEGPGLLSSYENMIRGFSRIHVSISGRRLTLSGELGSVDRLAKFITWFPILLGGGLAIFFLLLLDQVSYVPLIAVAPWIVLGPLMGRHFRNRSIREARALLDSALLIAKARS
jgi:hypothetical protein